MTKSSFRFTIMCNKCVIINYKRVSIEQMNREHSNKHKANENVSHAFTISGTKVREKKRSQKMVTKAVK